MVGKRGKNLCLKCRFYNANDGIVDYCKSPNQNAQNIFHDNLIVQQCEGFKT